MIIKSSEQMQSIEKARAALEARKTRSAWDRGVSLYISDLLDNWECNAPYELDAERCKRLGSIQLGRILSVLQPPDCRTSLQPF